ncbi:pwwp domain-containing protein [Diplodia corticola]|uniref:Pwwp domain-containing protein n=1 Tax=Diplodia corticola TaxID=236234 RepID=A0A1J9QLV3_9PEZI|nr:pwwp domain-containing protein [Diplodia corticola]OJD29440.1 pwwp domain-containing protein [Diplodia corticola]
MADQAAAPAPVASPKPDEASAPAVEVRATTADATTDGVAAAPKDDTKPETTSDAQPPTEEPAATSVEEPATSEKDGDNAEEKGTGAEAGNDANGAPRSNGRRKSTGGDKGGKKQLKSKKSMANLNLDVEPGTYWWARMKGYAAWPVIICDEGMLPETLLTKRPVSAIRPDGTYREDFADNGKNVRDRRYPVMFLGTNEFAWQVNTDLTRLDLDEVKKAVENNDQGKKAKNLWEAWKVAAEGQSLAYFKQLLMDHEKAMAEDAEERAAKEAEKAEKAAKKGKRKSKAGDEDVEMEDAAGSSDTASKKSAKKRKNDADADDEKPAKTPKTKLKVNGPKTPAESSATKTKKTPASKAKNSKKSEESATPKPVEEELTPEQKFEKRSKAILYLRHRLQKGFLTRDQTPKEEEMQQMAEYFTQLESHQDLEEKIIKDTKINKVLKAIIKLDSIPKEEVYNFKKRSAELLNAWGKNVSGETKPNGVEAKEDTEEPKTEEPKPEEPKSEEPQAESKAEEAAKDVEMKDAADAPAEAVPVEAKADEPKPDDTKATEAGDVAMEDAKDAEKPTAESIETAKEESKADEKAADAAAAV